MSAGGEYSLVAPEDYAWQFSLDGEHCSSSILEVNMYVSSTQSSYNVNNGNRHVLMSMPPKHDDRLRLRATYTGLGGRL